MKRVFVNRDAKITVGELRGKSGLVIGFDSEKDEVEIEVDGNTTITTSSDNIVQEIKYVRVVCQCGTIYNVPETQGSSLCHFCGHYF